MKSSPRVALAVALALPLTSLSCASTPPAKPASEEVRKPAKKSGRRAARAVRPAETARRSEYEPVLDELPDPEAKRYFEARFSTPSVALARALTPPRVTETALSDTARGAAPDLKSAELTVGATLKEGQRATLPVTIAPGACATFIAQGGLGAIEVDMFLLPQDSKDGQLVLAQDVDVGPIAIVGGRGRCFKNTTDAPLSAELDVMMRRGAGLVLVRGYRQGR